MKVDHVVKLDRTEMDILRCTWEFTLIKETVHSSENC